MSLGPVADELPLPSRLLQIQTENVEVTGVLGRPPGPPPGPAQPPPPPTMPIDTSTRGRRIDPSNGLSYRLEEFCHYYGQARAHADVQSAWAQCEHAHPYEQELVQWVRENHRYQKTPKHVLKSIKEKWSVRQFRDLGFGGWAEWLDKHDLRQEVLLSYAAGRLARRSQNWEPPPRSAPPKPTELIMAKHMQMLAQADAGAHLWPGSALPVGLVGRDMQPGRPPPGVLVAGPDMFFDGISNQKSNVPRNAWQMDMPPHYPTRFDAEVVATYSATGISERHVNSKAGTTQQADTQRSANDVADVRMPQSLPTSTLQVAVSELRAFLARSLDFAAVEASIYVFGSAINGFGNYLSDIDVVLKIAKGAYADSGKDAALKWLRACQTALEGPSSTRFQLQEVIQSARIPILKLVYLPTMRNIDVSVNNLQPLANTYLLQTYASLDLRVKMLGIAVKQWAKEAGLCGAADGWLSSYDLVLMTIYFLQVGSFALPSLQALLPEHDWHEGDAIEAGCQRVQSIWCSRVTLDSLRREFFAFYARDFCWGEEVVSVRIGRRAWRRDPIFSELKHVDVNLDIEDPFMLSRNLACHFQSSKKFRQFVGAIWKKQTPEMG